MSRHEIHGILFASGPNFKSTLKLNTPSGNLDLAPTILRILGVSGGQDMHERPILNARIGRPRSIPVDAYPEIFRLLSLGACPIFPEKMARDEFANRGVTG